MVETLLIVRLRCVAGANLSYSDNSPEGKGWKLNNRSCRGLGAVGTKKFRSKAKHWIDRRINGIHRSSPS